MGDTAAETLSEIEATRQRLETDLTALEARLPEKDEIAEKAKLYGAAAGGGLVALIGLILGLKKRSATKERQRHARETAEHLAQMMDAIPVEATAHVRHESSRTGVLALIAALAGVAISVANALQQRRGQDD